MRKCETVLLGGNTRPLEFENVLTKLWYELPATHAERPVGYILGKIEGVAVIKVRSVFLTMCY